MAKLQAVTVSGSADLQRFVAHDATEVAGLVASAQRQASSMTGRLSRSHSVVAVPESLAAAERDSLREMEARCKILCSVRMPYIANPIIW